MIHAKAKRKPGRPFGANNRKKISATLPMDIVLWLRKQDLSQAKIIERALLYWKKSTWKPIKTAPKDGTTIILWHKIHKCQVACKFNVNGWRHEPGGDKFEWLEATFIASWPDSAFTYWKECDGGPSKLF